MRRHSEETKAKIGAAARAQVRAPKLGASVYMKRYRDKLRLEAFNAYGWECVCCGEDDTAFLVFDHIDGGGGVHRADRGGDGPLREARQQGWPFGILQVLCANCNMAKERPGGCPHQQESVYLAGPMTGLPDYNYPAFDEVASRLRKSGVPVLSPAEHHRDLSSTWESFMTMGLRRLLRSGRVVLLPGWQGSRGARLEADVAGATGKLVSEWDGS